MPSNPFATRFIRPGAIPFLFGPDESVDEVIKRVRTAGWWGQIIGPHGSGKSTLLAAVGPALEAAGRHVVSVALHQGEHRLLRLEPATWSTSTQLIIDGYEQLSWWSRRRIKSLCRRHGAGLLVTAHTDVGLPTVFSTNPSAQLARAVVARLLPDGDQNVTDQDISTALDASGGNVREALFKLFDLYQERERRSLR